MSLTKWKIKDMVIELPSFWTKSQVVNFANTDIKVCNQCGKVDISLNHYSNCNPAMEQQKQESLYYKD